MNKKILFTVLSLLAISSTWAADSLKILVNNTKIKSYALTEIIKVEPTSDSLIYALSPSGRFTIPIAGQKWVLNTANVFSSTQTSSASLSSMGASSSFDGVTNVNTQTPMMNWGVQGNVLRVSSE